MSGSEYSPVFVFLMHLLCLQSFFPIPSFYFGFNAVAWSVSVEVFFYLLFPFLIRLSFSDLFKILLTNCLLVLILCAFLSSYDLPYFASDRLDVFVSQGFVYINPLVRLPEFVIGILSLYAFENPVFIKSCRKLQLFLRSKSILFSLISFGFVLSLIFCAFLSSPPLYGYVSPHLSPVLLVFLNHLFSAFIFALIIAIVSSPLSYLFSIFTFKPFVFFGKISFGFYLFHQPIMIRASQLGGYDLFGFQIMQPTFLGVLFYSLALSFFAFYLIEAPIKRLTSKLSSFL